MLKHRSTSTRRLVAAGTLAAALVAAAVVPLSSAMAKTPPPSGTWGTYGPVTFGVMAFGPDGRMYVGDCGNARVYNVSPSGAVSVLAGAGPGGFSNGFSGDGGQAIDAHFGCVYGLTFDFQGNLYVTDHLNGRIRKIDNRGIVTTAVGSGSFRPGNGFVNADAGKPALKASLYDPVGIAFDGAGSLFIADRDHNAIRKVDASGIISTVVGTGTAGFSGDGGLATAARLNRPLEVAARRGSLYLVDENNARIRKVTNGIISTVAGTDQVGCANGPVWAATLTNPNSLAFAPDGGLAFTDSDCHQVRTLGRDGVVRAAVGTGQDGCSGFNGPALKVQVSDPEEVRFGPNGDMYVSDQACDVILRIDSTGMSHLFATAP